MDKGRRASPAVATNRGHPDAFLAGAGLDVCVETVDVDGREDGRRSKINAAGNAGRLIARAGDGTPRYPTSVRPGRGGVAAEGDHNHREKNGGCKMTY